MTIPIDVISQLATLGLTKDQAGAVASMIGRVEEATASAMEAQRDRSLEQRRKADAERQARKRERDLSRDITLRHSDRSLTGEPARVEDKTSNSEIEPQEENKKRAPREVSEFRSEFPDLDTERLDALVKHRRSKRGSFTAHAARLFRRDAEECGLTIIEAVDTCISRNWITVKPEYFGNRQRAGPVSKPHPALDAADALMEKLNAVTPSETGTGPPYPRLVGAVGR